MSNKIIVAVDVQNDFVKGGALPYGYPADDVVPKITAFVRERLESGDHLICTMDTHGDEYMQTLEGKRLPVLHCINGTHGWKLAEPLSTLIEPERGSSLCRCVKKRTFGAEDLLPLVSEILTESKNEIEEIVLCGGCTSICLLANAVLLRAAFPNTPISVRSDLCFDLDEASHNAALAVLRNQQIDVVVGPKLIKCEHCGQMLTEAEIRECGCRNAN